MMAFSEDKMSVIATKLGTHMMLDSYTSDMCMKSWEWSSYTRAMIEIRADVELKDTIVVAMPKFMVRVFLCAPYILSMGENLLSVFVARLVQKWDYKKVYKPVSNKINSSTSAKGINMDCLDNTPSTTFTAERIDKLERKMFDEKLMLVDDDGKPMRIVIMKETIVDDGYDPYDDDLYDGQDNSENLQAICDDWDIKVCDQKKKYIIFDVSYPPLK
uniref:Uncharacterized protein n=1 Tax=Tanacetum cinerariifolium TaxID=118510 RepID=A0A6L2JJF3_TANCI|nr:hypothetical protein [Tanacetum cinerariifolium]